MIADLEGKLKQCIQKRWTINKYEENPEIVKQDVPPSHSFVDTPSNGLLKMKSAADAVSSVSSSSEVRDGLVTFNCAIRNVSSNCDFF